MADEKPKKRPAKKPASKKQGKKQSGKIKPRREKFVDNFIANGGNGAEAAREAGYAEGSAKQTAHVLLQDEKVKKLIEERNWSAAQLTAQEVIGTLAQQMRADITEGLDPDDNFCMKRVREKGMGHLIKTLTMKRVIEGGGDDAREVEILKVEFYSAQAAAVQLCKVLGLEQQARANELDARHRQRIIRAIEQLAEKHKLSIEDAQKLYLQVTPEHNKYVM